MRRIALLSASLLLVACQPQAPDGEPAAPPADAPGASEPAFAPGTTADANDFDRDLNLTGTEPFWSVQVRAMQIKVMRADQPDLVVTKPDPTVEGGQAVWKAAGVTVRLSANGPCSDGMSDRVYPFTAEIDVGGEALKGCGARADAVFPPT